MAGIGVDASLVLLAGEKPRVGGGGGGGCGRERWVARVTALMFTGLAVYLLLQHLPALPGGVHNNSTQAEQRRVPDKPRAHLTAKETRDELSILQWEDKNGLAFTMGDINYRNRSLVISTDGDYFVYSQVSFRGMRSSKCEFITHTVIKHETYPEPTSLLTTTKSICDVKSPWFVANYLGAVFQLKKGDRLVVQVSNVAHVDFTTEHKTFFGAFLL
ncbi:tumor necrosis factor ligand superfamily member 15-like [Amblyraja radiata]|uniref:tumor necrosis factor ligand superfamily member 15-like n=1 Tax=Amblyraja radiata TaxID=386614 RepID=UPI0014040CC9|nr:tumor necrosis factor ligand superfamily member 15-like [Amblyraja radiata]